MPRTDSSTETDPLRGNDLHLTLARLGKIITLAHLPFLPVSLLTLTEKKGEARDTKGKEAGEGRGEGQEVGEQTRWQTTGVIFGMVTVQCNQLSKRQNNS